MSPMSHGNNDGKVWRCFWMPWQFFVLCMWLFVRRLLTSWRFDRYAVPQCRQTNANTCCL